MSEFNFNRDSLRWEMDYNLCLLCQKETGEELIDPKRAKKQSALESYKSMTSILKVFAENNKLPVHLSALIKSDNAVDIMKDNSVVWHKSCRLIYSKTKATKLVNRLEFSATAATTNGISSTNLRSRNINTKNTPNINEAKCFFCEDYKDEDLHKVTTFNIDQKVRSAAEYLNDHNLLAKLSRGDLIALEARYHLSCLTFLYNNHRAARNKSQVVKNKDPSWIESVAFVELCEYIDHILHNNKTVILALDDLRKVLEDRMEELGQQANVNTTRFKLKILDVFPQLEVLSCGKKITLTKNATIISPEKYEERNKIFMQVAMIVRKHLFDVTTATSDTCQKGSVPDELLILLGMIFYGSDRGDEFVSSPIQPILTIAQLIKFNSFKTSKVNSQRSLERSHYRQQETPLVRYIANSLHFDKRSKDIIEKLHDLGICMSYKRTLEISTGLGNLACDNFKKTNVVCPRNLRKGEFVTVAVDNIDKNMSSTTSMSSFHGTAISVRTHPDSLKIANDFDQMDDIILPKKSLSISPLPMSYTVVESIPEIIRKNLKIPYAESKISKPSNASHIENQASLKPTVYEEALTMEKNWLNLVERTCNSELICDNVHWSSYHASLEKESTVYPSSIALLPLFQESAHTVSMMYHTLEITQDITNYLNGNQNPVVEGDQPLFTIMKELQWAYPEKFGNIVVMMGGLHLEMVILRCLGQWLEGSEWDVVLTESNIATEGVAQSFLFGTHVTKTRYAHQATAAVLHILKRRAFLKEELEDTPENFLEWEREKLENSHTFFYWNTVLNLELNLLQFVKSIRGGGFNLYVDVLTETAPWFFALNHNKYARWVTAHIEDMKDLPNKFPKVYSEFKKGKFVVKKTDRPFSAIAIDHSHEQENKIVKGSGGGVGLFDNPPALLRWMVASPEVSRLVNEFEQKYLSDDEKEYKHHSQYSSVQKSFVEHVKALLDQFEFHGNPFESCSSNLETLVTKFQYDKEASDNARKAFKIGKTDYDNFVKKFKSNSKAFYDPIHNNNLNIFKEKPPSKVSKTAQKYQLLKNDCQLFSRLYIGAVNRSVNLNDFFAHENQAFPIAISENGNIRTPIKSKIVDCLESTITDLSENQPTECTAYLADGSVNVRFINTGGVKTFTEYCDKFEAYLGNFTNSFARLDMVWDTYKPHSIKNATRQKRGSGREQKVEPDVKIPRKWENFLCVDENKTKIFNLLAARLVKMETNGCLIVTNLNDVVLSSEPYDSSRTSPCNHEEADTRLMVHAADAVHSGHTKIVIRTVDSDIVALSTALVARLEDLEECWVAYGTKTKFRYIPIHVIVKRIGKRRAMALPMFHALTGCDTVSGYFGISKATAWEIWNILGDELTNALLNIQNHGLENLETTNEFKIIEKFIIMMYDYKNFHPDTHHSMNAARKFLFVQKNRSLESCPPTNGAFLQHLKRAIYQGAFCWGFLDQKIQVLPDPTKYGWKLSDGQMIPHWSDHEELSKICREIIQCKCKKSCAKGRCKCKKMASLARFLVHVREIVTIKLTKVDIHKFKK